jgi:hydroxymethylpyrimidine pyrophosphatase-like HAD family hydrolase
MSGPVRLLAVDVDGTLLRTDGTIAPEDRAAIGRALAAGVAVTLATGRLSSSTLPVARELSLAAPLVCADGAVLFCPTRQVPLDQIPLAPAGVARLLHCLEEQGLAPFVFSHEAVCGSPRDFARFPFVAGWTPLLDPRDDFSRVPPPITAIGVGPEQAVLAAHEALRADPATSDELSVFPIRTTSHWVLRLAPSNCSKATGLERLARRLGIAPDDVAAIGDWYNDVPMLSWARRSFAMGHAPDDVKQAAKHTLTSTAMTGGAVAEALESLAVSLRVTG